MQHKEVAGVQDCVQCVEQGIVLRKILHVYVVQDRFVFHSQNVDVVIIDDLREGDHTEVQRNGRQLCLVYAARSRGGFDGR